MYKNKEQDARYAAQLDADATRERLAEIYATALLGACESSNVAFDVVSEEYDSFVRQVCDPYPKFEEILASPNVAVDEKQRMVEELCVGVTPIFKNFLKTLARRGRMDMVREIRIACRRLDDRRKGRVPVKVTTAAPLDETTKNSLVAKLRKLVGGEPEIFVEVDPGMIGGIIVRAGDVVYDASIASQLNKVRQNMIDRSAHEIQSRRDCFRNPEGN